MGGMLDQEIDPEAYELALSQERERLGLDFAPIIAAHRGITPTGSSVPVFNWDPDEHPRDLLGRFRGVLSKMSDSRFRSGRNRVELEGIGPAESNLSIRKDGKKFVADTDAGAITLGDSPEAAAKAAFELQAAKQGINAKRAHRTDNNVGYAPDTPVYRKAERLDEVAQLSLAVAFTGAGGMKAATAAFGSRAHINAQKQQRQNTTVHAPGAFQENDHPRSPTGEFIEKGDSGPLVDTIQGALGVKSSGDYDMATIRAVRRFQRQNDLQVDGVIGQQTAAALLGNDKADSIDVGAIRPGQLRRLRNSDLSGTGTPKPKSKKKD